MAHLQWQQRSRLTDSEVIAEPDLRDQALQEDGLGVRSREDIVCLLVYTKWLQLRSEFPWCRQRHVRF